MKTLLPALCLMLVAINAAAQSFGLKVSFAGKTEGKITVAALLSDSMLHTVPANSGIEIVSFKFSVYGKDKKGKEMSVTEIAVEGNILTALVRNITRQIGVGSKVYFEFIKARMSKGPDTSTRSLPPLALTIAEK